MPCNCSNQVNIGCNPPFANLQDVVDAINTLANCCLGSIANSTDPINDPSTALDEGFPYGLATECTCEILWLKKANGSLYASADSGASWFAISGPTGSTTVGTLTDFADPNDGAGSFTTSPSCVDPNKACWATDSVGNVWVSFDQGSTWVCARPAPTSMEALGLSTDASPPPSCATDTLTTMTGMTVTDGEITMYNPITGEITIPVSGWWYVSHRVEFAAGDIVSGGLIESELHLNGAVLRASQDYRAAHSNGSYPTSAGGSQRVYLEAGDILLHKVLTSGSGYDVPDAISVTAHLITRE